MIHHTSVFIDVLWIVREMRPVLEARWSMVLGGQFAESQCGNPCETLDSTLKGTSKTHVGALVLMLASQPYSKPLDNAA
jgi:hypothetical protein